MYMFWIIFKKKSDLYFFNIRTDPWVIRCVSVTVPWPYLDRVFVNVSDRDLLQYDHFWPVYVPDRSLFLSIFDRFMSVFDRFMTFFYVYGLFLSFIIFEKDRNGTEKFRKAHETVENAQERWTCRNA